jgi:predicted glycogen debranching enzyme
MRYDARAEWLEVDGLGGYAMGTASGMRTRRYHGLLCTASRPPRGRMMLVNGFDAGVETPAGSFALTTQGYAGHVLHPDGARRVEEFWAEPWPRWIYALEDGTRVEHELLVAHGAAVTVLRWRLEEPRQGATLFVRPFLSGRDHHALHRENPVCRSDAAIEPGRVTWRPYASVPAIVAVTDGRYTHDPLWYRSFEYEEEIGRGLDFIEDLLAPGFFRFDLSEGEALLVLAAEGHAPDGSAAAIAAQVKRDEMTRRRLFASPLHRAADAYLVGRDGHKTLMAGYPWFTDWGRDTFISMRGLCLATDRLDDAEAILQAWAPFVDGGMLPNRFPEEDAPPEYNSVDAALWYVVAVDAFARRARQPNGAMWDAVEAILAGYAAGTRHGIRVDEDGLLACGAAGTNLTWMDAKVEGRPVTPRLGKPVEVQALWVNALTIGGTRTPRWAELAERARASFSARFWDEDRGCLHDVVDVEHRPGMVDGSFRPNQILAVGGLPLMLLPIERARRLVDAVETRLVTPLGLRTLERANHSYQGRHEGAPMWRDSSYHQGTVWPWLLGPFVEAWVRVREGTMEARREAWRRFLEPIWRHIDVAGLGHVSEIADGDFPHRTRGCPFQAWSLGEVLRLAHQVLS